MAVHVHGTDPGTVFTGLQKLGVGAFGTVYFAREKRSGDAVAVKVLELDDLAGAADVDREVGILQRCKNPYITAYHSSYSFGKQLWIAMEFCDAGSASSAMSTLRGGLSESVIRAIITHSLLGLRYLHEQKVIHRDVKAGNILLKSTGQAKLADFGVSASLQHTLERKQTATGSPYWMAPELIASEAYTSNVDLWSLGITAVELAETRPPLSHMLPMSAMFVIAAGEGPPPSFAPATRVSPELRDFVAQCTVRDHTARPPAATLLAHPACLTEENATNVLLTWIKNNPSLLFTPTVAPTTTTTTTTITATTAATQQRRGEELTSSSASSRSESDEDESQVQGSSTEKPPSTLSPTQLMAALRRQLRSGAYLRLLTESADASTTSASTHDPLLLELATRMSNPVYGLRLGNRKRRGKAVSAAFVGREAVDWMYENLDLDARSHAVALGSHLLAARLIAPALERTEKEKEKGPVHFQDDAAALYVFNSVHIADQTAVVEQLKAEEDAPATLTRTGSALDTEGGLTERDWKLLLVGAQVVSVARNAVAIKEGQPNRHLWRIRSGRMRVEKSEADGRAVVLALLGSGAMFGEMSALDATGTASASIVADTEAELYQIELSFLTRLFVSEPGLARRFWKNIALKIAQRLKVLPPTLSEVRKKRIREEKDAAAPAAASPAQKTADAKFRRKFELPGDELLIRRLRCQFRKGVLPHHGKLFISQRYVCFSCKVFGYHKRFVLPVADIRELHLGRAEINIVSASNKKYSLLGLGADLDAVYTLLNGLCNAHLPKQSASLGTLPSMSSSGVMSSVGSSEKELVLRAPLSRVPTVNDIVPGSGSGGGESRERMSSGGSSSSGSKKQLMHAASTDRITPRPVRESSYGGLPGESRASSEANFAEEGLVADELALTRADWQLLLGGFMGVKSLSFTKGEVVMKEGSHYHRIYQIARGSCRIEQTRKDGPGPGLTNSAPEENPATEQQRTSGSHVEQKRLQKSASIQELSGDVRQRKEKKEKNARRKGKAEESSQVVLGVLEEGQIFGEISFLQGGAASASVVAASDVVDLYVIEAYFVSVLFVRQPALAGRFYRHLALELGARLTAREQNMLRR